MMSGGRPGWGVSEWHGRSDHTRQREVARAPTFARMTSLKVSRAGGTS